MRNLIKFLIISFFCILFLSENILAGGKFNVSEVNPKLLKFISKKMFGSLLGNNENFGLIPNPFALKPHSNKTFYKAKTILPDKYDLRENNLLSPVKNQGAHNTCWSFATYGSLESNLIKVEQAVYDFSENNLINQDNFDWGFEDGGNINMSSAYLSRGNGPVLETCDPYPDSSSNPDCSRVKYIENIVWLPPRADVFDNDYLKQAIYNYGAVYTSMYYNNNYFDDAKDTYYYPGNENQNHAVVLVGWDDNKSTQHANPGAWIVRNSWGDSWGESGYFYISYYDNKTAFDTNAYFVDEPDLNNGDFIIHQYDTFGTQGSVYYNNSESIYGAVVFKTSEKKEKISAISFYTDTSFDYEIMIYDNTDNPNNAGNYLVKQTGSVLNAGFHTVNLNNSIVLNRFTNFLIVVKFIKAGSTANLRVERQINGYTSKATCNSGESFVSSDGSNWDDLCGALSSNITSANIKVITTLIEDNVTDITPAIMLLLDE